jgi:hypothetical protein
MEYKGYIINVDEHRHSVSKSIFNAWIYKNGYSLGIYEQDTDREGAINSAKYTIDRLIEKENIKYKIKEIDESDISEDLKEELKTILEEKNEGEY